MTASNLWSLYTPSQIRDCTNTHNTDRYTEHTHIHQNKVSLDAAAVFVCGNVDSDVRNFKAVADFPRVLMRYGNGEMPMKPGILVQRQSKDVVTTLLKDSTRAEGNKDKWTTEPGDARAAIREVTCWALKVARGVGLTGEGSPHARRTRQCLPGGFSLSPSMLLFLVFLTVLLHFVSPVPLGS